VAQPVRVGRGVPEESLERLGVERSGSRRDDQAIGDRRADVGRIGVDPRQRLGVRFHTAARYGALAEGERPGFYEEAALRPEARLANRACDLQEFRTPWREVPIVDAIEPA
jgi:hypothetical protein